MSAFDPYYKWLGIPESEQPPHHYRLLGIAIFESDLDVIEAAADRQMAYIRGCATGPYVKESQRLLNELSTARVCLLNPAKKQAYDGDLKARVDPAPAPAPSGPSNSLAELKVPSDTSPPAAAGVPLKSDTSAPADVANQERRAQKLLDEQNFEAAIPILVKLAELQSTLYKKTSEWAAAELPRAKQRQEKLRDRVRAACDKARALLKTYNYAEVTQLLEAIPTAARTEEAKTLLSQASQNYEDSFGLHQEIEDAVKSKRFERLLPLVKRFLKLKPDNVKMQKLARDLARNSPERATRCYKGTGRYFDVAGRLVEIKELAVGLGLIVALVIGIPYAVKHLGSLPAADDLMTSLSPSSGVQGPSPGEEHKLQPGTSGPVGTPANTSPAGRTPQASAATTSAATNRVTADDDSAESPEPIEETWTSADEWIISPGNRTAVHALPDHPPAEYTVSLKARRLTGKNTFAIGLPVGDKQVLVALDAHGGTVSGLEFLDGNHVNNNESTQRRRLLLPDREVAIKCTVRKEGISCTCDGVKFLDWRGDLSQLSLPPDFAVPDSKALFLATVDSRVAVRAIKVSVPESLSANSWNAEADALAGSWTLARGLSEQGLNELWVVRNTKGEWSVKRSFTDKSGKAVGAAVSDTCKFSSGVLQFTERWEKKPVSNDGDGGTITMRLDGASSDRVAMTWRLGNLGGKELLVRVGTTAAAAADGSAFVGTWGRVEGANKEGLTERWEIKRIKGEWSVKRTYTNKAGKVVGYSLSEKPALADGTLRYTERLKQKPLSNYVDVCTRTLKFEPDGSGRIEAGRIEATWEADGRGGKETLVRTASK